MDDKIVYYNSENAEFYKIGSQYHLYLGSDASKYNRYHKVCYSLEKMLDHITKLLSEYNIYRDDLLQISAMIGSGSIDKTILVHKYMYEPYNTGPTPDHPIPIYQQSDRYNSSENETITAEEARLRLDNMTNDRPSCFRNYDFVSHESKCLLCGIETECIKRNKKLDNEKFKNTVNKENKIMKQMDNLLNELYPSRVPSGEVAITMLGKIAVARKDGSYVRYDAIKKQIQNQMNVVLSNKSLDKMYMLVPTPVNQLKADDIIKDNGKYYQILKIDINDSEIEVINLEYGVESDIKFENNIFLGTKMYRKVVSLFDMNQASSDMMNGMNPMMLMMLMDDNSSNDDTIKMFAMMSMMNQGNMQSISNPMMNTMMLMMLSDKSGDNDLIKTMLMMNMMTNTTSVSSVGVTKSVSPADNSNGELVSSFLDDGK